METFTQPKIAGYRQLSEAEGQLMSQMKNGIGSACQLYMQIAKDHVAKQRAEVLHMKRVADAPTVDLEALTKLGVTDFSRSWASVRTELHERAISEIARLDAAQPERWIALANTHFQQGLMALVRAIAQPESF